MVAPKKSEPKAPKAPKAANADGSLTDKPVKGAVTLDRDKKFYDVHSGGNVKFEQDGNLFNLEGNQVDLDGNLINGKVFEQEPQPPADNDHVAPGAEPFPEFPADANGGNPDAEKTEGMTEDDLAALGGK